jgi:hypothetical protein
MLQTDESLHSNHRLGFRRPVSAQVALALTERACTQDRGLNDVDGFETEASPQWPLRGHSLAHPVSGEIAPD